MLLVLVLMLVELLVPSLISPFSLLTLLAFGAGDAAGAFVGLTVFISFFAFIAFIDIVLLYCYTGRQGCW